MKDPDEKLIEEWTGRQRPGWGVLLIAVLLLILAVLLLGLTGCASTTLYRDGMPIARFQGDMTGLDYQDGNTRLRASTVDHSAATAAGGQAAKNRIESAGTAVAASGITYLLK